MPTSIDIESAMMARTLPEGVLAEFAKMNGAWPEWEPTPLIEAVAAGDSVAVAIEAAAADPNAADSWGLRPLDWAAIFGGDREGEGVEELLAAGADPSLCGQLGMNALHWAACSDSALASRLSKAAPRGLASIDDAGRSPLACALNAGCARAAADLVGSGASLVIKARRRQANGIIWDLPPLAAALELCARRVAALGTELSTGSPAASSGQGQVDEAVSLVGALLRAGADPNEMGAQADSPRQFRPAFATFAMAFQTVGRSDASDALFGSIAENLIDSGMSMELIDSWGRAPLHHAAMGGRAGLCASLIAKGADLGLHDNYRDTPEAIAKDRGHAELAEALAAARERASLSQAIPAPAAKPARSMALRM